MRSSRFSEEDTMPELQLTLTADERDFLIAHLEQLLKNTRVEEHRTRSPSYREHVIRQEDQIVSLLTKLGQVPE